MEHNTVQDSDYHRHHYAGDGSSNGHNDGGGDTVRSDRSSSNSDNLKNTNEHNSPSYSSSSQRVLEDPRRAVETE